jgi:hypothetical protein
VWLVVHLPILLPIRLGEQAYDCKAILWEIASRMAGSLLILLPIFLQQA